MNRGAVVLAALCSLGFAACAGGGTDTVSNAAIYDAWRSGQSHLEVTASGSVARVLGLRNGPSGEHEGFLLHLRGAEGHGLTVRVEDNTDITGPMDVHAGDDAVVRGEYIYDPRGGIIHYTHHDPRGHHVSGYVRVNGRTYF